MYRKLRPRNPLGQPTSTPSPSTWTSETFSSPSNGSTYPQPAAAACPSRRTTPSISPAGSPATCPRASAGIALQILVKDDHGILDLVAGSALSLPDAAVLVVRLSLRYAVPAERVSYDKLGIGRDFRNHLVKHGLGDAVGYAGSGRPREPKAFCNLFAPRVAWTLHKRLDPERHLDDRYPLSSRSSHHSTSHRGSGGRYCERTSRCLPTTWWATRLRLLKKEDW